MTRLVNFSQKSNLIIREKFTNLVMTYTGCRMREIEIVGWRE